METTQTNNVDALRAEQQGIGARIERAAVEEDTVSWLELRMRADALPLLIREARTAPLRAQLARLEEELDGLVEQRERALVDEPPPAPQALRGTITKHMMRQRILDGIAGRERAASEDRRQVLARIAAVEGGEDA